MPRQQLSHLGRLRRHKAQPVQPVPPQKPAHRPVAEPAPAIEDHQQPVAEIFKIAHTIADACQKPGDSFQPDRDPSSLYTEPIMSSPTATPAHTPLSGPPAARRALLPRRRQLARAGLSRRRWRAAFRRLRPGRLADRCRRQPLHRLLRLLGTHDSGPCFSARRRSHRESRARLSASFGASTAAEADLAERITACYPAIEKMRFVSSGTEAHHVGHPPCPRRHMAAKSSSNSKAAITAMLTAFSSKPVPVSPTFGIPGSAGVPRGDRLAHPRPALSTTSKPSRPPFAAHPGPNRRHYRRTHRRQRRLHPTFTRRGGRPRLPCRSPCHHRPRRRTPHRRRSHDRIPCGPRRCL